MKNTIYLVLCLFPLAMSYLDIPLTTISTSTAVSYSLPMNIQGVSYKIGITLEKKDEFIRSLKSMKGKKKGRQMIGQLQVTSMEGYTVQGWKRFFMDVLLYVEQKKSHKLQVNLSKITQQQTSSPQTHGLISFAPNLAQNSFLSLITTAIKNADLPLSLEPCVSFYYSAAKRETQLQIGGYEQTHAKGHGNGILFYQKQLGVTEDGDAWLLQTKRVSISKVRNNKWESFAISQSNIKLKLTLEFPFLILPNSFKADFQSHFESDTVQCGTSNQFQCTNMTAVDLALNFISFQVSQGIFMNVSLYDLRDRYDQKSKLSSFFIKFGNKDEIQIGPALLRSYYLSLNLKTKTLLFSPLNHFPSDLNSVNILRFLIFFMVFMLGACMVIIVWQQFNQEQTMLGKARKRLGGIGQGGIKLVSYQKVQNREDDDE